MKNKQIDWYFWGPGAGAVTIFILIFLQAYKLPDGSYDIEPNVFTYFLLGVLLVCVSLMIFGKVKETLNNKINGKTILYTAIAVPVVFVVVYFVNN